MSDWSIYLLGEEMRADKRRLAEDLEDISSPRYRPAFQHLLTKVCGLHAELSDYIGYMARSMRK